MSNFASTSVTPLLIQRCRDLRTKIEHVASLEKDAELLNQLGQIKDALQRHREQSSALIGVLTILHHEGLVKREDVPTDSRIAAFRKLIDALQKKLSESRTKLKTGNDWAKCDKEAGALVKELDARLKVIWSQFVGDHNRNTDGFQAFRHIEGCSSILQKLDALNKRLTVLKAELPKTEADAISVRTASAEMDALIAEIDLGDVPEAVQEFLRKAAQGGVSLSELTDEIFAYLRLRKFVNSLRVASGTSTYSKL